MRKKTPATKKTALARTEARARTPERRARKAEVCAAPAESAAPREPVPRPPMPFELARMLEEETWWRVVRVQSAEPTSATSRKSRVSSRIALARLRRTAE